jgi:hypothetical protein
MRLPFWFRFPLLNLAVRAALNGAKLMASSGMWAP